MTETPDPLSLDFSALRTLRLVHGYRSFSRAAETLDVNQSTVSYTVDRLRRAFGDPLFVRQGGQMVSTERCEEIVASTSRMLDEMLQLAEPRAFDPGRAETEITISCNYYERATILPRLMRRLRRVAPGLRLTVRTSTVEGKQHLDRGESDLVIGPVRIEGGSYYRRTLFSERAAVVIAHDAPPEQMPRTEAAFLAAPQVVIAYGDSWRSRFLMEIAAAGKSLNQVMSIPSPAALPELLEGTDLVATLPSRLADHFGDRVQTAPSPFRGEFEIDLTWTSRTHHSPMHAWLREQIAQACQRQV
ncbi:LysR family transcriptional regulator [Phaeobacter sp. QD34_3]|uniref:LysR family transcriptional regulator n=1 Tax=unclassified Phaeobacter TaxID=2621772 RepID=UPI00237FD673|nr:MULTISPECIES: LysR family transcriptional regulator [unclassified Phaeobacter]MDE4133736.1 LysR family transcriptional regulator [Phaeobacter sp. QD34_3]MDE4137331.1 LysR family transcriptional regulator [Phaeobacter sp. QD34_24]